MYYFCSLKGVSANCIHPMGQLVGVPSNPGYNASFSKIIQDLCDVAELPDLDHTGTRNGVSTLHYIIPQEIMIYILAHDYSDGHL